MATGTKLVTTFLNAEGKTVSFTHNYAASDAEATDIRIFVAGMIANGAIFENVPVTAKGAKLVTTTEQEIALSA